MRVNLDFRSLNLEFDSTTPYQNIGKIHSSQGLVYEASIPRAILGCKVEFVTQSGNRCFGEVVSIDGARCKIMPYEDIIGVNSLTKIYLRELTTHVNVGQGLLGRVIDFQGEPIDGKGPIKGDLSPRSIYQPPINPLKRPPIREVIDTGISAVNAFLTTGKGQRLSILAGSGVGKSTLMGMIARNTNAQVNVIALVGERGREVLEFIESDLGTEGLKRSVVLVATSDSSALIRSKAAFSATTIAEYFRDQGLDVIFMMDSVTRFAMANREIGMSIGEPPGQKGYGPSVFAKLPKLMERAGTIKGGGSITGIYTVLVEGGDMDEPIADAVRAIADGHVVLSRELAAKNHYPAIDVLESVSRVMPNVVSKEHKIVAAHLRDLLSAYRESEDLINVGAYVRGTNAKVDKALVIIDELNDFLKQDVGVSFNLGDVFDRMVEIARRAETEVDPSFLNDEGEEAS